MDTDYTFPKLTDTNLFQSIFGTQGVPMDTTLVLKPETKQTLIVTAGIFALGLILAAAIIKK